MVISADNWKQFVAKIRNEKGKVFKMKSLGMVRTIDGLGRITLPIEIRRMLDINTGDGVEMFSDKDRIILQKYAPSCLFCGEADNIVTYKEKKICKACLEEMKKI